MRQTTGLLLIALLAAILLVPGLLQAQGPEPRWMNVATDLEGPDYIQPPQHYKTLEMMLAEAGLGPAPLGPPPQPVFGTRELLVILVELTDAAPDPTHTVAYFTHRFFDTSPPSVRDFYNEVSYGNFTYVPGDVLGWYASSYSTFHWDNGAFPDSADHRDAVYEAIQLADADFDFSGYDTNSDGTVSNDELTIFIIVSGNVGGAFHYWTNSNHPVLGPGPGSPTCDGKVIEGEFSTTHEDRHIGSYCHELGHDLGLPDLYDTNGGSEGIGEYGLMGGGSWTFSHPTAWSKIQLGWITPTIVNTSTYATIDDAETNAEAYVLVDPSHSTDEYFLVENRYPANSYYETIGAPVAPNGPLPDSGLVIYHIDEAMVQDWITSGINNVNTDETHKGVDVETAEHATSHVPNADDLDASVNRGDGDDLWDCGEYDFHDTSNPCASIWYGGGGNQIGVRLLPCVGPEMLTFMSSTNEPPVAQCKAYTGTVGSNCCKTISVADIDDGSYDPDGAHDVYTVQISAVDGGPPTGIYETEVCGIGSHTVTLVIVDVSGASDECDASVELTNQAPVAVCQSYSDNADENCCIMVGVDDIDGGSYDPDGAGHIAELCITAVDGTPVACLDEVQVCGEGSHAVTLTAIDGCGVANSCDATVDLVDVTPPEIDVELNRYVLWPPNHKMADIVATVEVTDNCDPSPTFVLASITSNEPDNNGGDGETDGDIQIISDVEFQLRSERSGKRLGRIYTITYVASDLSGNTAQAIVFVRVPHDQDGMALSSVGFTEQGTGFDRSRDEFVVVIPSRMEVYGTAVNGKAILVEQLFDATRLDMSRTYVGNTMGVLLPQRWAHLDQNDDGLMDLALYYRIAGVEPLVEQVQQTQFGEVWIGDPIDPVGIHYESANGVDYLVPDIFNLGEPVELGGGAGAAGVTDDRPERLVTRLFPVQPNPFSASTTIRFSLAAEEHVTVQVYDARGGLVRALEDGIQPAGMHQITWYGLDSEGVQVAPGVYFVRFTAGSFGTTEKMMLLK